MKTIILISGFKRAGKDTLSDILKNKIGAKRAEKISFARPMKEILSDTLGITLQELESYKNNPERFKLLLEDKMWFYKDLKDFREVLQHFGDAVKRQFGQDVWSVLTKNIIKDINKEVVIISDWRYLIEHATLNKEYLNLVTVRVAGGEVPDLSLEHSSETELINFPFDYTLDNRDKDFNKLSKQADKLLSDLDINKTKVEEKHINEDLYEFIQNYLKLEKN